MGLGSQTLSQQASFRCQLTLLSFPQCDPGPNRSGRIPAMRAYGSPTLLDRDLAK